MPSDFFSLNSWNVPGVLYQGANPVEVIEGEAADWPRLREALARAASRNPHGSRADRPHPAGGAVGCFRYDGSFRFGIYPEIEVVPAAENNPQWKARRGLFPAGAALPTDWVSDLDAEAFAARVRTAQEYIAQGDIYQINLTHRFRTPFRGNPYLLFECLMERSPAPGAAFLESGDASILCASPELFLRLDGRRIVTKPIKGTRPRDRDPLRDRQLAYELITDPKEQAELVMITDLERNDLGRICEYGTVSVTDLLRLESYPQVYHLVSTVEGLVREGVDPIAAISACFPGGSITGAPKRRAMEIIAELEPVPRGLYTGAIGWIGFNGDAAFSMAIRTMIHEGEGLQFHVGSGITADSDPLREYEETLHKSRGLRLAVEAYHERLAQADAPGSRNNSLATRR
ncbi:para-aminobenzoate synthetase component 1 [Verrucomicrobium sp. GAS474]|uniref:anthranilate synthase component I family protein n=1 Tax=Verrucomicrobium sp. GAS474 TaxID=1882831 RepID=UPI00087C6AC5|nr:anthranilate synthase component I family protein [Verrucomicrobium sp. GAS474]SDU22942.1 para-aminobenzoate synthetase component 1 [Verrucomicrobium sp. GAS474]